MNKKIKQPRISAITQKAEKALKEAVAGVVKEHQASGMPLAVWKNGKAVWLPADQAGMSVREPSPKYGKNNK